MNSKFYSLIGFLTGIFFSNILLIGCSGPTIHEALTNGGKNALIQAISDGSDVNEINKDGLSPLHITVKKCDTTSTRLLLENGANVEATDKEGKTVVQTAFISAFGSNLLSSIEAEEKQSPDVPSVRNLAQIMNAVRQKTGKIVNAKGNLTVGVEIAGFTGEGGMQMIAHVNFLTEGKSYEIDLSRFETKYINVDKSGSGSDWNLVLRPGNEYYVTGIENKGEVKVTLLEFIEPAKNDDHMIVPIRNWLPDTWAMFMELPWIKDLNSK